MVKRTYEELARDAELGTALRTERKVSDTLYAVKKTEEIIHTIADETATMAIDTKANTEYNKKIQSTVTWAWRIIGLALIGAFLSQVLK